MSPTPALQLLGAFWLLGLFLPLAVDLLRGALGLNRSERG